MGTLVTERGLGVLTVMSWPGIGAARTRALLRTLQPTQDVIAAARSLLATRSPIVADAPAGVPLSVQQVLETCESLGLSIVTMLDDDYPASLSGVSDAPPILYVLGSVPALKMLSVAVVGTRQASETGKKSAFTIAQHLASRRCSVVSGLALGIDSAAHDGALAAQGVTVAVMAHGLDTVAPSSNKQLASKIVASGGALVAEHPPGTPPRPPEFARRNRIQSGLSRISVIVESGAEGGAMIQAKFTHDQGRILCAVVSDDPLHNRAGADRLIREFGAIPVRRMSDLDALLAGRAGENGRVAERSPGQLEFEW